jgi:3-deoxy-D-manno-octulosonic-acid transferase
MRKKRAGWNERFGHVAPLPAKGRRRLMVHGVSMGEQGALRTLVPMLVDGGADVVVSASTDTGMGQARKLFGQMPGVTVVRYPLDFSSSVRRFLDAVAPDAVALCELEVWPNFIAECSRRSVPVAVINGRLSAKSFKGYKRLRPILRPTFARLALAAVQDEAYADRFRAMGVPDQRVTVSDTMKWDTAHIADDVEGAQELAAALGIDRSRPLVVAGSTSEGEERLLHDACPPGVQLLCAPRKPERFDAAAADLPGCVRRSGGGASGGLGSTKQRFLLDTLGELRKAYALADVVVVGRSFGLPGAQKGGSDPIEPVALGKATIIGPSYANFTTVVRTLEEAGGLDVASAGELRVVLGGLLSDAAKRAAMTRRGRACIREHQGSTRRHATLLLAMLNTPRQD